MKKASLILTILVSFFFSSNLKAQTNEAFYAGKWKIIVLGTPYGDVKMGFVIEKKEYNQHNYPVSMSRVWNGILQKMSLIKGRMFLFRIESSVEEQLARTTKATQVQPNRHRNR